MKIKVDLDKNNNLLVNYQSKIRYDTLIQNVVLKERINLLSIIIVDIDTEKKLKISRIKYSERRSLC